MLKTKTFWFLTIVYLIVVMSVIHSSSSWKPEDLKCKLIAENYCVIKGENNTLQVIDILHVDEKQKIIGKNVIYDVQEKSVVGILILISSIYLFLVVVTHLCRSRNSSPGLPDFSIDF